VANVGEFKQFSDERWVEVFSCPDRVNCNNYVSSSFGYQIYQTMQEGYIAYACYWDTQNDPKVATCGMWYDGEIRAWSEWDLHNALDNTDSNDTDWSDNDSKYFIDKTVADVRGVELRTTWEVKDAWQLEETVYLTNEDVYFWFTNEIIWTGSYFSYVFKHDGEELNKLSVEPDMSMDDEFYKLDKNFMTPFGETVFKGHLDLAGKTYVTTVYVPCDAMWGECLIFESTIFLDERKICYYHGDEANECREITDEKWAPA